MGSRLMFTSIDPTLVTLSPKGLIAEDNARPDPFYRCAMEYEVMLYITRYWYSGDVKSSLIVWEAYLGDITDLYMRRVN